MDDLDFHLDQICQLANQLDREGAHRVDDYLDYIQEWFDERLSTGGGDDADNQTA